MTTIRKTTLSLALAAGVVGFAATSAEAGVCTTGDVTLNGTFATTCVGQGAGQSGNSNISASDVDYYYAAHFGGGNFTLLDGTSSINNVVFTITDTTFGKIGDFNLNWTGGTLPMAFDLAIALKASNSASLYFFDDFALAQTPGTAKGHYTITITNNGGQIPGLSNISLFGRKGTTTAATPPTTNVPEPAALGILGLGLAGLFAARRSRRAVAR